MIYVLVSNIKSIVHNTLDIRTYIAIYALLKQAVWLQFCGHVYNVNIPFKQFCCMADLK